MSLPSLEQNQNEPEPERDTKREHEAEPGEDGAQQTLAGAEAEQGSPVSIIPVAPMHWRMLAFALDGILISLFSTLLLTKVLLPQYHPVGYSQYVAQAETFALSMNQAMANNESPPSPMDFWWKAAQGSEEMHVMFAFMAEVFALCVIGYFVLCERFMAGGSLGKSMFRLRVISLNTGRPPSLWESVLRSLIKLCPLAGWPFLLSYLLPFGNRLRRAGHDWLARTLVVSDVGGYVPHVTPPRRRRDADEGEDY